MQSLFFKTLLGSKKFPASSDIQFPFFKRLIFLLAYVVRSILFLKNRINLSQFSVYKSYHETGSFKNLSNNYFQHFCFSAHPFSQKLVCSNGTENLRFCSTRNSSKAWCENLNRFKIESQFIFSEVL